MVYIDEVDVDQEGIAEIMLDESAIAQVARRYFHKAVINPSISLIFMLYLLKQTKLFFFLLGPGTSLRLPGTSQGGGGPTPAVRFIKANALI